MSKQTLRETKRDRKRRHLASRSAMSSRNIVEHAMDESAKVVRRNRSFRTKVLRTDQTLLQKVVYVPPKIEQE
jgi:hypothetical protein